MALKPLVSWVVLCVCIYSTGCSNNIYQTPLPINVSVSPNAAAVVTGQTVRLTAKITNSSPGTFASTSENELAEVLWSTTEGTIDSEGNYTAPSGAQSTTVFVKATSKKDQTKFGVAIIHVVAPGQVSPTVNTQVALYSIVPGAPASVSVQFGENTNYGLTTWGQPSPSSGPVKLFVAGMKAKTPYHMSAVVEFADGARFVDSDHLFITDVIDAAPLAPQITATTPPGEMPQGGVELLAIASGVAWPTITDLSGNILWAYTNGPTGGIPQPIKLLPNGHFIINFSEGIRDGSNSVLQEVDLAGSLIWQMSAADLNKALAEATCAGCNITVVGTHHDFAFLPNGHLIVIAATQRDISGTTVTGDVLIDLDENRKPVWLWNEFDHLDINRRPYLFPDWTHTNAILYSPDDGNLIISIRHQNWLVKIDYANGNGAGDIVWRLGYQGDFTLVGGVDPTDWFYAQHDPSLVTANSAGQFSLIIFDNGDDRIFPAGVTCGTAGESPCLYSTVPILQIDERAMTATLTFHPTAASYSFFGGNAEVLPNGNVEYCESAGGTGGDGEIFEVTQDSTTQTVWHMLVTGQYAYRGQRIPSMYPGVQW